ncbi:MAG TPA: sensor histidine kinase [Candidatus Paenibacillus intestinavium]|nr:sensor histidine kinase [Candidatus Paenibacillus intestinavium]
MVIMIAILSSVGFYLNDQVSKLLQVNTERHMENTAVQATGNIKLLLNQIDNFTAQIATNAVVQSMLQEDLNGKPLTFAARQDLQQEVRKHEAYMKGVHSIELYSKDYSTLLPLVEDKLDDHLTAEWIARADQGKGELVWLGTDVNNSDKVIAMRHVRLMNQSFAQAGYLLIYLDVNYFDLTDLSADGDNTVASNEYMWLTDTIGTVLNTNSPEDIVLPQSITLQDSINIDGNYYYGVQRTIEDVNWQISILTPVDEATEGISVLRTGIIISLLVGIILFLIATYFLSGMISKPILRLIRAMRVARLGTLKVIPIESATIEINELNHTYNQMVDSLNGLIKMVYEKEILQSQTELKALQAQINPHFLFNTLEALYWEMETRGEEQLAEAIVAMSGIFRYVINRDEQDEWVTLGDELDHAERYLKIMKMRMVERLEWSIEVDPDCRVIVMPKLLVQPLIENAIYHGVEQQIGSGIVKLSVVENLAEQHIRIKVTDNGPGMSQQQIDEVMERVKRKNRGIPGGNQEGKSTGVGLSITEQRIKLYFGTENEGLLIESEQGKGTTVSFDIPIVLKGEER